MMRARCGTLQDKPMRPKQRIETIRRVLARWLLEHPAARVCVHGPLLKQRNEPQVLALSVERVFRVMAQDDNTREILRAALDVIPDMTVGELLDALEVGGDQVQRLN